ncbi:MAG: LysR family transcriptional regulator [Myxococcota bacterium]
MHDWNEIAVFVKVVETGGFQRAAEALGLPKSSVSRKVASLEERLGVRLLHRTTRSVSTTDIGQGYYDRLARLVADAEAAEEAVKQCQSEPTGTLRVSVPSTGPGPFMRSVFAFAKQHARVSLEVIATDRFVDLVRERVDVAIRAGELADASLVARKLARSRHSFVASPSYLEERGRPETVADLHDHDGIALGRLESTASWHLDDGKTVPIRGRIRVTSMALAIDAAVAGLGIAMIPDTFAAGDLEAGRLERVLPELHAKTPVSIVYPSRDNLSTIVRAFVDHVVEHADRSEIEPVS